MNPFLEMLSDIRKVINAKGLEELAKLPKNSLGKHYRWLDGKKDGRKISATHYTNILRALCETFNAEITIGGWKCYSTFDSPAILAVMEIPDRLEIVEILDESGNSIFEYRPVQYRQIFDDFDFPVYFLNINVSELNDNKP